MEPLVLLCPKQTKTKVHVEGCYGWGRHFELTRGLRYSDSFDVYNTILKLESQFIQGKLFNLLMSFLHSKDHTDRLAE